MTFPPLGADLGFSQAIQAWQPEWLTVVMKFVSALVRPEVIFVAGLLVVIFLHWRKHDDRLIAQIFFLSFGNLWTPVLKDLVSRSRPSADQVHILVNEQGFSFPSGHAVAIVLIGGIVALLIKRLAHHHRQLLIGLMTVFVFLVGYARIYLGVHWLSDVIAGYIIGLIWIGLVSSMNWLKILQSRRGVRV